MTAVALPGEIVDVPVGPHSVTQGLVECLQSYFSNTNNLISKELVGSTQWDSDPNVSRMYIGSSAQQASGIGTRPSIVVRRGQWTYTSVSVGNITHGITDNNGYLDHESIFELNGTHSIRIVAMSEMNADLIANEIVTSLISQSIVYRNVCGVLPIVSGISAVSDGQPEAEYDETYVTDIGIRYAGLVMMHVNRMAPIWKQFVMKD